MAFVMNVKNTLNMTPKFKAWRESDKKMWDNVVAGVVDGEVAVYNIKSGVACNFDVLIQFTGLKDTDGTEIYEGDILLWHFILRDRIQVVKYESYGFEYADEGIGYGIGHNKESKKANCKIIGNIYQNPELINQP